MIKVFCDMCGKEIDYEKGGINLDFNHKDHTIKLCADCANKVCDTLYSKAMDIILKNVENNKNAKGNTEMECEA